MGIDKSTWLDSIELKVNEAIEREYIYMGRSKEMVWMRIPGLK